MARLGDICKFQSGGTPSKSEAEYYNGGIPWITTVALNGSTISEKDAVEWITEKAIMKSAAKIVPANSIMVGTRVGVGKVAINSVPMSTSQDVISLLEIDEARWSKAYICKFILAKGTYLNSQARGATIKGIKIDTLAQLQLPEIPFDEQAKIAGIIDKIDGVIALRKEQLAKLDELVKARFVEMFGGIHDSSLYPYTTIGSFTTVMSGGTPDRRTSEYWKDGTIRWVKTTELQNCVITDTEEKITQLGMFNSSAKMIPADSILIAMYGQGKTRGMTGYIAVACTTNQACACILPSESVNQKYLWEYMILSYEKMRDMAKGGNQPNLNTGIIKNFPVLMPPRVLQDQFATFVEQTNKSKLTIQASLDKLEVMKKALMQEYFG